MLLGELIKRGIVCVLLSQVNIVYTEDMTDMALDVSQMGIHGSSWRSGTIRINIYGCRNSLHLYCSYILIRIVPERGKYRRHEK